MTTFVPKQFVWMKSSGPTIERSTWLSAAKWTTASWPRIASSSVLGIADVALHELVPRVVVDVAQRREVACVREGVEDGDVVVGALEDVTHVVRADETGAAGDEDAPRAHVRSPHRGRQRDVQRVARGVLLIAGRERRVGHAPVGRDRGIVPRDAELVVRVVVPVDQIGDDHVGQRREPVGDPGRDEHPAMVEGAVGSFPEVDGEGLAVGGRAFTQVVEHDPGAAHRHVPVVGLMEVVVQADDGTRLAVAAVALDHLAALGEPLPPVGLDEDAALVAVDGRLDDVDTLDHVGRDDVGHQIGRFGSAPAIAALTRAPPGSDHPRAAGWPRASRPTAAPRPRGR